jgi:xylulokinase
MILPRRTDEAVLGVDIGTGSSKAALVATDGRLIATATRDHTLDRPSPGLAEMDAQIWWTEFAELSRELVGAFPGVIRAVGVSGMGPCVLLTDEAGAPLRPAILYGIDSRAEHQITALTERYGADAILERCGSALSTQAVGPKLAWIADNEPAVAVRARLLFMPSSWLVYRLTGEYVLDHHSASQACPLYDVEGEMWYERWWDDLAAGITPPRLMWSGDIAGTVSATAALETGLSEGTPVIAGTIDAWAEAASVDALNRGDLMLMYGSTMFLVHTLDELLRSPTFWATVGLRPGSKSLAGGLATSGALTTWLKDIFGAHDYNELLAAAEESGPGARGLLMLPYFAGERTPIADPRARGIVAGLTLAHGQGDVFRAALESIAMAVRHNIEAMTAAGAQIERLVAVGGGTRGRLWMQIVSDVLQREQHVPTHTVGASYGAAFLAASLFGKPSISEWNPIVDTVRPVRDHAENYDELYTLYRELYPATEHVVHALAARQLEAHESDHARERESVS